MMQAEHGVASDHPSAIKAAVTTFFAFLLIGGIPLIAYLVDLYDPTVFDNPFWPSCVLTGIAFFAVGAVKSRFVDQHWLLGGLEILGVGALAAGMAYTIGLLLRPLAEGLS
jgi:VIT1/CCC1 family predicted Fe2+/Mn2+ transporter